MHLAFTFTRGCDGLQGVEFGAGNRDKVPQVLSKACPFGNRVAVSPMRDLLMLPVFAQVSVEKSRSAANPFVSSFEMSKRAPQVAENNQ